MFTDFEITGRARTHVVQIKEPRFAAHREVTDAFLEMRAEAAAAGFDLQVISSFRDFKTQLKIWNNKFSGKKPLFDIEGNVRDTSEMTDEQIVRHIFDWSALPGGSRHQWGTEIDVFDRLAIPKDYKVKLLPEEVSEGGVFHPLHQWLDANIHRFGFFKPYKIYQGGMFPEPWHLSYAPVSLKAIDYLSFELLDKLIKETEILAKEIVLELLPEIYDQHILNITSPEQRKI